MPILGVATRGAAMAAKHARARRVASYPRAMSADELLRAVIENPNDDGVRLVYIDALIQAGDPRGELLANHVAVTPAQLAAAWHLGDAVSDLTFDRGFPVGATISLTAKDRDPLRALDHAPIRAVRLRHDHDFEESYDNYRPEIERERGPVRAAQQFARDPRTARLGSLDLSHQRWGDETVRTLLGADLRALCSLQIGADDAQTYAVEAILANPALALDFLYFYGRNGVGYGDSNSDLVDGVPLLAASPRCASLWGLTISRCGLDHRAADQIASSPHFAELVALDLEGGHCATQTQRIGDAGLEALARSPHLTKLEYLAVGDNAITDAGLAAIARSPTLAGLTELGLEYNRVHDAGLAALSAPGVLPALRSLALAGCPITAGGLAPLVAAHAFEELYLAGCDQLGDAGVIAVATSPHVRALRYLSLHVSGVTAAGIDALVAAPFEQLARLTLPRLDPQLQQQVVARFGAALEVFST